MPSEYTTADAVPPEQPRSFPGAGSYVLAVLLPVVGVVLAIVAFARGKTGPGVALLLTSALSFAVALALFA